MELPSKDQLNKLSNDTNDKYNKIRNQEAQYNCEKLWNIMVETLNNAVKSNDESLFIVTRIDKSIFKPWHSSSVSKCRVGPTRETMEQLLAPSGVRIIQALYVTPSVITYDKIDKTISF